MKETVTLRTTSLLVVVMEINVSTSIGGMRVRFFSTWSWNWSITYYSEWAVVLGKSAAWGVRRRLRGERKIWDRGHGPKTDNHMTVWRGVTRDCQWRRAIPANVVWCWHKRCWKIAGKYKIFEFKGDPAFEPVPEVGGVMPAGRKKISDPQIFRKFWPEVSNFGIQVRY